jgi:hypothetical protein
MARLMRAARAVDPAGMTVPLLLVVSEEDDVVDPATSLAMAAAWGGPAVVLRVQPGPGDDPMHHVIAGAILSPGLTGPVSAAAVEWARGLAP